MKILYRLYYFVRKLLFPGGFVLLFATAIHGQSLCESASTTGFEFIGPSSGCGPLTVKVENNNSSISNVQYHFYYNGESLNEVQNSGLLTTSTTNTYFAEDEKTSYTILQYGKDNNGNDFYSCKNVTVRANNKPKFSYTVCNNDKLEISIPENTGQAFESYTIDWGGGNIETVDSSSLPYTSSRTVDPTQTFSIVGNSPSSTSCEFNESFTIQDASKDFSLSIDKLEMLEGSKVELTFSGSEAKNGYSIFMNDATNAFDLNTPLLTGQRPGTIQIDTKDSTKSHCFVISRAEVCGGTEVSPDICTTPILGIESNGIENIIEVKTHKINFYDLSTINPILGNRQVSTKIIWSNGESEGEQVVNNANPIILKSVCSKKICYKLESKVDGILFNREFNTEVISNLRCLDSQSSIEPLNRLFSSLINENEANIEFTDNSNWPIEREKYFLYKKESSYWEKVDSTTTISIFKDFNYSPSNCYQISFLDKCQRESELSPVVCPNYIELEESEIQWSDLKAFPKSDEVDNRIVEIINLNVEGNTVNTFTDTLAGFFEPDISQYQEYASFMLISQNSEGHKSLSNIVTIPIATNLYFPTAFSPNGDQINDTFEIKGNLGTLASFELYIYNRLAHEVFRSTDPEHFWDGTLNGSPLPSGTYQYALKATNKQNEEIRKHGYMVLLR